MQNKTRRKSNKIRYDIARFVFKYFPEARLAASDKEFILNCPWHDGHKKKLYVNASSGMYNCFVCGAKGGFSSFVRRVVGAEDHTDVSCILKALLSEEKAEYIDFFDQQRPSEKVLAPSVAYPPEYYPLWFNDLGTEGRAAEAYLLGRGLTKNQISYYRLGFCIGGRYDRRVLIPTFGPNEELVTFVCRDYTGKSPYKVLNPPEVEGNTNKDWVFNLYNALRTGHLIVTEGVFDAIAVGVSGVALFGKKATDSQLAKLVLDRPLRITCCLDADAPMDNEVLASQLSGITPNVFVAKLPEKDPADLFKDDPEALKYAILHAERYEPRWLSIW